MVDVKTITTNTNVTPLSPLISEWKLYKGFIYKIELFFPPGSSGLLGVRIRDSLHQLYPTSVGEWFIGDNCTISFDDLEILNNEAETLLVDTYNLDTDYTHLCQLRIGILTDTELVYGKNIGKGLIELSNKLDIYIERIEALNDRAQTLSTSMLSMLGNED